MKCNFLLLTLLILGINLFAQNNPPTFDLLPADTINVITGQNMILIANVDDGDAGKIQNIIFSVQSDDESSIVIDSVSYKPGDKVAILFLSEQGKLDTVTITVSAQDQEDYDGGGTVIIQKSMDIYISGYNNPGVYYAATQTAHWQAMPYGGVISPKAGQEYVLTEARANDLCKEDFFWGKMWGYIMPPSDGYYNFTVEDGEGAVLYLSTDATSENIPAVENPTASYRLDDIGHVDVIGTDISMEAGKMYYFEAYHREIILDYDFSIDWSGPGVSSGLISSEHLTYDVDQYLPNTPENFSIITTGVNDVVLQWDEAFDRGELIGYNVYVNGFQVNVAPITETDYVVSGLSPETSYSVIVRSEDSYGNLSIPSSIINFTTYQTDVTAPTVPQNLMITDETGISALLSWDASTDNETEVRGYNVYVNGSSTPINNKLIYSNSYWLTRLSPNENYDVEVTALDAGINESSVSNLVVVSTTDFCPTCNQDGQKKGAFTVNLDPIAKNIGNGTGWVFDQGMSNVVKFPYFEFLDIENAISNDDLEAYNKSITNVTFSVESDDPYEGKYSAKISGSSGGIFTHSGGIQIQNGHTYMLTFANKKSPGYSGVINVKYYNQWVATHFEEDVIPTDEWKVDTIEFTATADYNSAMAFIEFKLTQIGTIYLDNIQLVDKTYYDGSAYETRIKEITEELQPGALRWGGLIHNFLSFKYCTGPNPSETATIGDFFSYANSIEASVCFNIGISDSPDHPTDWYNDPENTVNLFMEYIAGDSTTAGGKIRVSEGYIDNFLDNCPGMMIEMGNEVWGGRSSTGVNHGSPFNGTIEYRNWARTMARHFKSSPYFDPEKMFLCYSGRYMNYFTWNDEVLEGDTGELDYLAVSGYNGSNLNYDIDVPKAETELGWHKDMIETMMRKIDEAKNYTWALMLEKAGRVMPMYFYETDATSSTYQKRVGHAINYIDYIATAKENGFNFDNHSMIFGSQWGLLENNYRKNPQFYTMQLFNNHCKGAILDGNFITNDFITNVNNDSISVSPIGCHAYNNDTIYSFMLCSRDFENDYALQLDLPDAVTFNNNAKMYVFSGENFNSLEITIDTIDISDFDDGIIINIPKFSVVYIKAYGTSSDINDVPWNNLNYTNVTSLSIVTPMGTAIEEHNGYLFLETDYAPVNALASFVWQISSEDGVSVDHGYFSNDQYIIQAGGTCTDNGEVTVRLYSVDNPSLFDEVTLSISGQGKNCENNVELSGIEASIQVYPNPVKDVLNVSWNGNSIDTKIEVLTMDGRLIRSEKTMENPSQIDLKNLQKGIYILNFYNNRTAYSKKIILE